ncbi:hypothetical protein K490DRAFT_69220 [Saccharata proteae CBS 121410]|uniref:Uncharacterized protein n=1 Tax=Saccharata proteae CBS 121410 TaxID=1314787 RepID=A0A9P4LVE5_9PEZI|nr:hypothetical protein K490DRAFT_69220 [Saccharata proteae CBS 121410]
MPDTLTRITHFASLTGGKDSAIVFILASSAAVQSDAASASMSSSNEDGLRAYMHLASTLLTDPVVSTIPVLTLPTCSGIDGLLQNYIRALSTTVDQPVAATDAVQELLPWCTSDARPMGQEEVLGLTDVFASLLEMAEMAMKEGADWEEKGEEMVGVVGLERATSVVEFWREEWVAE